MIKEEFVWIEGYENEYDISNYGRIRSYYKRGVGKDIYGAKHKNIISKEPQMFLKISHSKKGTKNEYARVNLGRRPNQKHYMVARLVYNSFGNKSIMGKMVLHKDGNCMNNNINNLEVVDPRIFMKRFGGENNPQCKLTKNITAKIRSDYKDECRNIIKKFAKEYEVSEGTVRDILNESTWKQNIYLVTNQ